MKVLDKSLSQNKFTCIESWISDRQADISKQTDRLDCGSTEGAKQSAFIGGLVQHQKLYECLEIIGE